MHVPRAIPHGQVSVADVVGIVLPVRGFVGGDSEDTVPGIGFPINPAEPTVDGVLEDLGFCEFKGSELLQVFVGLGSSYPDFLFRKEVVLELCSVGCRCLRDELVFVREHIFDIAEVRSGSVVESDIEITAVGAPIAVEADVESQCVWFLVVLSARPIDFE